MNDVIGLCWRRCSTTLKLITIVTNAFDAHLRFVTKKWIIVRYEKEKKMQNDS